MEHKKYDLLSWFGALAIGALILDGKTVVNAGTDAVQLCMRVLIPSLFPFFVFSPLLAGGSFGIIFRPLARLLRLPDGAESILLVSFLGGYPVGAAVTAQHAAEGSLRQWDARRMMAFCSNAGPSFLFGIGLQLFPNIWYCWLTWVIHILSAILVGFLTPGRGTKMTTKPNNQMDLPGLLANAIKVMATVCGWVVIFRIIIAFLDRWVLWAVPEWFRVLICGVMELANGCCELGVIGSVGLRMVMFSGMLAFGGCCVFLQTHSAAKGVDLSAYLPGKLAQTAFSILLCSAAQLLLPVHERWSSPVWLIMLAAAVCLIYAGLLRKNEKTCGNPGYLGV